MCVMFQLLKKKKKKKKKKKRKKERKKEEVPKSLPEADMKAISHRKLAFPMFFYIYKSRYEQDHLTNMRTVLAQISLCIRAF